ncbi:MAG: adenosylcobinamide-GDP ribazoletransferase [Desulfuromusa sp.]|nr:adenosylcobinamide-GDP ribazoletransferase [Desulfuromusa sp.]
MIKQEIHYFFTALMFFTRIPCPSWTKYRAEYLHKSRKYFPVIGWIVGGFSALVFWLAVHMFPLSIAVVLSVIGGVLLTGAFHEDGFSDVCDGFGGGYSKDQILTIMKDSRIGVYGAIGMLLLVLLKLYALYEIAEIDLYLLLITLINAHCSSRFIASTFVQSHDYVQDPDRSKAKPIASLRLTKAEMMFSFLLTLLPLLLFPHWIFILPLLVGYLAKIYLGYYFKKNIGGYTGDCLGATQQIAEVLFYLTVVAICRLS